MDPNLDDELRCLVGMNAAEELRRRKRGGRLAVARRRNEEHDPDRSNRKYSTRNVPGFHWEALSHRVHMFDGSNLDGHGSVRSYSLGDP